MFNVTLKYDLQITQDVSSCLLAEGSSTKELFAADLDMGSRSQDEGQSDYLHSSYISPMDYQNLQKAGLMRLYQQRMFQHSLALQQQQNLYQSMSQPYNLQMTAKSPSHAKSDQTFQERASSFTKQDVMILQDNGGQVKHELVRMDSRKRCVLCLARKLRTRSGWAIFASHQCNVCMVPLCGAKECFKDFHQHLQQNKLSEHKAETQD